VFYENTRLTLERFGLHLDASAFWTPHGLQAHPQFHIFLGTEVALTRAVEITFSMFAHECGDNINISIYMVTSRPGIGPAKVVSEWATIRERTGQSVCLWHVAIKVKVATGTSLANSLFLVLTSSNVQIEKNGSNRTNGSNLTTLDGKRLSWAPPTRVRPVTNSMARVAALRGRPRFIVIIRSTLGTTC
jgi:hypothetical protein